MALWGNKDNVGSGSTVTLDYDNKVVSGWAGTATGTGTTFGQIGAAKTGDIISFGQHGSGTYFGEAVIVSIASSLQCTIASTEALSGSAIAGVNFTVSEKPVYTLGDSVYNIKKDASPSFNTIATGTADQTTGIGSHSVGTDISDLVPPLEVGDYLVNDSGNVPIIAVGLATAAGIATCIPGDKVFRAEPPDFVAPNVGSVTVGLGTTRPIVNQVGFVTADVGGAGIAVLKGSAVIPVKEILTYHLMVGDVVNIGAAITDVAIASIAHTTVSLASTTPVNINVGTMISFSSSTFNVFASAGANNDETIAIGDSITYGEGQFATREFPSGGNDVIQIDEALVSAITSGLAVTFRRSVNGYDAYVYGVSGIGASSALASSKQYITDAGWVGVTTYLDNLGNLRVKKETLVAMSGITTGNAPAYPPEYDA